MLEVRLLGTFELRLDGDPVEIPSRPAQTLTAYLFLNPGVQHRRERLAGLLWPDSDESNARSNLRHTLWRIRKVIGEEHIESDKITVSLPSSDAYWMDVAAIESLAEDEAPLEALMEGLTDYQGDLLPGFYDEWVILERDRIRGLYEKKVQALLNRLLADERWDDVDDWAERWIAQGQTPEPAYRALMRAHAARGDQAGVASAYRRCERAMREALDVEPSEETRALYEQLSQDAGRAPRRAAEIPAVQPVAEPPGFLATDADADLEAATEFAGRQLELAQLEQHFQSAAEGDGRVAFVVGDAGRGKTALLTEFSRRIMTLDPVPLIAAGVCNVYTGIGDPYLPFREVLAMLTGDVEAQWLAGAISLEHARRLWRFAPRAVNALLDHGPDLVDSFIPGDALLTRIASFEDSGNGSLARLSGLRSRKSVLQGDSSPHQNRIFEEYTNVVLTLSAEAPVVLILDDLHWADVSSVSLLFHLSRRIEGHRVFIVGAYRPEDVLGRSEEDSHPLVNVLSELKRRFGEIHLDLDRLDTPAAQSFVNDLLDSEPNDLDDAFRQELVRTTGGHALFVLELLQEMKQRGDLVQDPTGKWMAAPELRWDLMPARIEGVIERRVNRLDDQLREALSVASVEGETFTVEVVARVLELDPRALLHRVSGELERDHRLAVEYGVVNLDGQRISQYRFRHNLIQKYLYQQLGESERGYLHEAVGNELEALYARRPEDVAVQLARHYRESGNREKTIRYLTAAGGRALRVAAYEEAIGHLSQALEWMGSHDERLESARRDRLIPESRLCLRARLHRKLGQAEYGIGALDQSREHLERALALLGKPVPEQRAWLAFGLFIQVLRQAAHRLLPIRLFRAPERERTWLREAAFIYKMLDEIYLFSNDLLATLYAALRTLNLAERAGPSPELARAYGDMAVASPLLRLGRLAEGYKRRAWETAQLVDQPAVTAYVLMTQSAYMVGEGAWKECEASLLEANRIHAEIGDWKRLGIGLSILLNTYYYRGDLEQTLVHVSELADLAERSGDLQHQTWGLAGRAEYLLRRGRDSDLEEVVRLLKRALALFQQSPDRTEELRAFALLGQAHLRLGDLDAAEAHMRSAVERMAQSPPSLYSTLDAYAAVTETTMELLRSARDDDRRRELAQRARKACKELGGFAAVFPIGLSRAELWKGCLASMNGQAGRAQRHWRHSLEFGLQLGMPYDSGLARMELARHLEAFDPARTHHLQEARAAFDLIGAERELLETDSLAKTSVFRSPRL